jgi:hypothetical protein
MFDLPWEHRQEIESRDLSIKSNVDEQTLLCKGKKYIKILPWKPMKEDKTYMQPNWEGHQLVFKDYAWFVSISYGGHPKFF